MTKLTPEEWQARNERTVAYLRHMAQQQRELAIEFAQQADRWDTAPTVNADRGHTWRISVELRGSSIVKGDEHHHDAPTFKPLQRSVDVRAWSLSAAFARAAALPLSSWFDEDDEDDEPPIRPTLTRSVETVELPDIEDES